MGAVDQNSLLGGSRVGSRLGLGARPLSSTIGAPPPKKPKKPGGGGIAGPTRFAPGLVGQPGNSSTFDPYPTPRN